MFIQPVDEINKGNKNSIEITQWINITIKGGSMVVKDEPLASYLFSEGIIDSQTYKDIKVRAFGITFYCRSLTKSAYEFEGKKQETLQLRGYVEANEKYYGINIKTGFNTVSASYLLTGMLMTGNPFNRLITLLPYRVWTSGGYPVTKVWVSLPDGEQMSGYTPDALKDKDNVTKLNLLKEHFPESVFDDTEASDKEVEEMPL